MRRTRRLIVLLGIFLTGVALAEEAGPLPFPVARAAYRVEAREQIFDGVVEAVNRSTVSAQISGRIEAIYFDVDDYVPKGEVILRFRDKEFKARLAQAEAALKEAQARHAQALAEYRRVRRIYEKRLVSKQALDKADAELKAAGARFEAAKAHVAEAREQLDHTVVRAPYSGIVVKRHVEVGESANAGQPLMTGLSLESLRVSVAIPQSLVEAVRRAGRARVLAGNGTGDGIEAERLTVFPYADPRTHTFRVRLHLPPGRHGLYPGMFVKAAFVTGKQRMLTVPAGAVVYRSEVTGVYVVGADGRVALRQVRLGRTLDDGSVEILAGLEENERVALDPIKAGVYLKAQRQSAERGS